MSMHSPFFACAENKSHNKLYTFLLTWRVSWIKLSAMLQIQVNMEIAVVDLLHIRRGAVYI